MFLKYPERGRVKTRLAASIGEEEAMLAYRQLVAKVLEQCRESGGDLIAIAFDPAEKLIEVRIWLEPYLAAFPGEVVFLPQVGGDLGARLESGIGTVMERNHGLSLAVIGTDCVGLDSAVFAETWEALSGPAEVVFGPSEDGGYYLVAINEPHPNLFREIPWSSEVTLEVSLASAETAGLVTHLLPSRIDVDTENEWREVASQVTERRCVFFDRDGVVNRSPGPGYVLSEGDFHLNPGIAEALSFVKQKNCLAILVTSQKGVGKGLLSEAELDRIHQKMQRELQRSGAGFDGIYAYTGRKDCHYTPNPEPGMLYAAAQRFFIDLPISWMIGDADRDIEMAKSAGLKGTLRIVSEKPIQVEADYTVATTLEILSVLEKIL